MFRKAYHTIVQTSLRLVITNLLKAAERISFMKRWARSVQVPDFVDLNSQACRKIVIKSVSCLGRAGLLKRAAPESQFIFIIRHPCGQVASILQGLRRSLFEEDIPIASLARTTAAHRRLLTAEKLRNMPLVQQLAWGWVLQNEMAIESLQGAKHLEILYYEDLATQPETTAKRLFDACGLEWCDQVSAFLHESTKATGRERYYDVKRDPTEAINKWKTELTPAEIGDILDIAGQCVFGQRYVQPTMVTGKASKIEQTTISAAH